MAEYERLVLDFYQLPNPYPLEWPADKDNSDDSSDEETFKMAVDKRKSRFQALERATSARGSHVPGTQKTGDGVENLVQRDEPDPLGRSESVVRILRQTGLPVQDDVKLRGYQLTRFYTSTDKKQAIASSYPLRHSRPPCSSPRYMRMPQPMIFCRD